MEGKSIGNLLGGVSQQPESQRFGNMAEESINAWPSLVEGLSKRPPSIRVANIKPGAGIQEGRLHIIERDGVEWYAIYIYDSGVTVSLGCWDINPDSPYFGEEVGIYSDTSTPGAILSDYMLGSTVTDEEMGLLTVGDTTFILNKLASVAMKADESDAEEFKGFVTVRSGAYGEQFGVRLNAENYFADWRESGSWTANTSPPGDDAVQSKFIAPGYIAGEIKEAIDDGPGAESSLVQTGAPGSLEDYRLRIWNATSGNFRIRYYTMQAGSSFPATLTTADIAYNASTSTVKTALRNAVGTPFTTIDHWSFAGGNIETGYTITHVQQLAGDTLLHMEVIGASGADLDGTATLFDVNSRQNVLEVERINGLDFTMSPEDSSKGSRVSVAKGAVKSMADLPTVCRHGFKIKVQPDPDNADAESYYVRFESDSYPDTNFDEGKWVEDIGFEMKTEIDPLTMPHALVSQTDDAAGTRTGTPYAPFFLLKEFDWDVRSAGDDDTNPAPSFFDTIGRITGMSYHKGRLMLFGGDAVLFSEAGNPGNLFRTTVAGGVVDSDRIDVVSQLAQAADFRAGTEIQEKMILWSETSQVKVGSGGELLSPSSASLSTVSRFSYHGGATPVVAEYFALFPFIRGGFSGVRQFSDATNGSASIYRSDDITEHVSHYLGGRMEEMAVSSSVGCLAAVTDERDVVYLYKWSDSGKNRVQSAWQKLAFHADDRIRGVGFIRSKLFLAVEHASGVVDLEMIDFADGQKDDDADFPVLLDRRFDESVPASIVYSGVTGKTTVTLTALMGMRSGQEIVAYERHVSGQIGGVYAGTVAVGDGDYTFEFQGDLTGKKMFFGVNYEMRHSLSRPFLEGATPDGRTAPEITGRTQVRRASFDLSDTGYLRVEVSRDDRDGCTEHEFDGVDRLSGVHLRSSQWSVPISGKAGAFQIDLVNDAPFPCSINSMEYQLNHRSRSRRGNR